jgi:hypothetical protein
MTETGYSSPTTFIVPVSGYYLITYKLDVRISSITNPPRSIDCASVLTRNNIEIEGSTSLIKAEEVNNNVNHVYVISTSVLSELLSGDFVSLLFWSNDLKVQIGDPSIITGLLPTNVTPIESTASISFTCVHAN